MLWRLLAAVEIGIDLTTLQVVCIVFIATLIRSAFGFGEALVAVPLLAFYIPLEQAAPLAVLVSITIAAIVVVQDWKKIHLRSTAWLVLSTLAGIPLGLRLLTSSHQSAVKASLGAIIIVFSVYSSKVEVWAVASWRMAVSWPSFVAPSATFWTVRGR